MKKMFFCIYDEDPEYCHGCDHEYGLHQKNDGYSACMGSGKCCDDCVEITNIKQFNEELAIANKNTRRWHKKGWKKILLAKLKETQNENKRTD